MKQRKNLNIVLASMVVGGATIIAHTIQLSAKNVEQPPPRVGIPAVMNVHAPQERGERSEGWVLAISMDKAAYEVGEEIRLTIIQQNVSREAKTEELAWHVFEYRFQVDDNLQVDGGDDIFGDEDRWTRYRANLSRGNAVSFPASPMKLTVPPNNAIRQTVRLNSIWDMTRPAEYRIKVSKKVVPKGARFAEETNLFSNELVVTVHDSSRDAFRRLAEAKH